MKNKRAVSFAFLATLSVTGALLLGDGWRETATFALGAVWAVSILMAWVLWNPEA